MRGIVGGDGRGPYSWHTMPDQPDHSAFIAGLPDGKAHLSGIDTLDVDGRIVTVAGVLGVEDGTQFRARDDGHGGYNLERIE